jgi:hypothetical protein
MGLISDLGVDGSGILAPQHKNRWAIEFNGLPGGGYPLRVQAITADRPKLEFEKIPLDRYNSRAYTPGKYTFSPINLTFEADIGGQVPLQLQAQVERQQQLIAPFAAPRLPAAAAGQDLKFALRMEMLDGDQALLEEWYLQGCYFENLDYGDLDYSASETVKIVCVISYDHATQLVTGFRSGAKATGGA